MYVDVIVERTTKNKLSPEKVKEQTNEIAAAPNRKTQSGLKGLIGKVHGPEEGPNGSSYKYWFTIRIEKKSFRSEETAQKALDVGKKAVERAAESRGWKLKGDKNDIQEAAEAAISREKMCVPHLDKKVLQNFFSEIHERDAHIRLIHESVKTAVESNFEDRNHTLLFGIPAAAKTILFKKMKEWYEQDSSVEHVACINATTLSKAGLETWLLEKAKDNLMPEILFFDEIEKLIKSHPDSLLCLLAVMDGTGEIARLNARIGKQTAKLSVLVWGTCNNRSILENFHDGALWSRFTKKLPCVRPSRELMHNILMERLRKRAERGQKVDTRWAKEAIDYAFDVVKNNDPRFILGLLDGEDRLLDGSYFKDISEIESAYARSLSVVL